MNTLQQNQYNRVVREVAEFRPKAKVIAKSYKNQTTRMDVDCGGGHVFGLHPDNFFQKRHWCPTCGGRSVNATRERFVEYVRKKEGRIVGKYRIAAERVEVECKMKHLFECLPKDALRRGDWCSKCSGGCPDQVRQKFYDKVAERKGKVVGQYIATDEKCDVDCGRGHVWSARPHNVVGLNNWCPFCADSCPIKSARLFEDAVTVRGGRVIGEYVNNDLEVEIDCGKGHRPKLRPHTVKDGTWCPLCKESHGEVETRQVLTELDIPFIAQYHPPDLTKSSYRYDFFITYKGRVFLIEFDGRQHFDATSYHNKTPEDFTSQLRRDQDKTQYAIDNNISLIRLPYTLLGSLKGAIVDALESPDLLSFYDTTLYAPLYQWMNTA
jgi:hypothetical protein